MTVGSFVHYVSVNTLCKCMSCKQSRVCAGGDFSVLVCGVCLCAFVCVCVCVCVCAEVTEVYDTLSCLSIVSDRAATEESKYFELGWQPHEFFNSIKIYFFNLKYLYFLM